MSSELLYLLFLIPVVYWTVSLILFCFPQMVWKPRPFTYSPFNEILTGDKLFCIGHRGGAREGTENTLESFSHGDKYCHMFEMDVMPTKDGKLVVHHDLTLQRTCGVSRNVQELDYTELPRFRDEFPQHFGDEMGRGNDNKIPLLREVFEKFPTKPMNIELKNPTRAAAVELNNLVTEFGRESITVWGTIKTSPHLRELNPVVQKFYDAKQILKMYLFFVLGILPFVPLLRGFVEIPMFTKESIDWIRKTRDDGSCKQRCLFSIISCVLKLVNCITGFLISHLKKRGIVTFYFVLNQQQDFKSAVSKGCAGIMTDKPSLLSQYLSVESLLFGDLL